MLNTQTEFEIGQVNGTLSEKEELLRKITENHMELEKVKLISYKGLCRNYFAMMILFLFIIFLESGRNHAKPILRKNYAS